MLLQQIFTLPRQSKSTNYIIDFRTLHLAEWNWEYEKMPPAAEVDKIGEISDKIAELKKRILLAGER